MASRRVIIAGAGFGGLATAAALRRALPAGQAEIVLIDRRDDFVMGLRKTWAALGMGTLDDGRRRLADVPGVTVETGEIESLDPGACAVDVGGRTIAGDALVVGLGARHAPEVVPGLGDFGINTWDRAEVGRAARAIAGVAGGRLVVGIFGLPYSCPPAPFELALLARDRLGPAVAITVFSPAPIALPVVGAAESAKVERLLAEHGIEFLAGRQPATVAESEVRFADGSTLEFDVLLGVPPHRCPQVLVDAGLVEAGGWLKPDPRTLETQYDGVYAIGDCTVITLANGLPLPKAGIFAELEGEVVAARIADRLAGRRPAAVFGGDAYCYLETGGGRAAMASGAFLADPPRISISEPSTEAWAAKAEFERSRLRAWFGQESETVDG